MATVIHYRFLFDEIFRESSKQNIASILCATKQRRAIAYRTVVNGEARLFRCPML